MVYICYIKNVRTPRNVCSLSKMMSSLWETVRTCRAEVAKGETGMGNMWEGPRISYGKEIW